MTGEYPDLYPDTERDKEIHEGREMRVLWEFGS